MDPDTAGSTLPTDSGDGFNMKFSLGTPPLDIYAAADTGSDLVWTQCQPCQACYETKYALLAMPDHQTIHQTYVENFLKEIVIIVSRMQTRHPLQAYWQKKQLP
ncbi:putative nepenthesin [Rosa chinensis]|uniref:Putative nepenthesin n=1 Tax=Rosa chinensis TaxID=74649 RepID=A0A2P6S1C6_ROSCH|nr:putative nepenthesin [Rosa chinensis]